MSFWAADRKSIYYQNSAYKSFKRKTLYGSEVGTLLLDMLDGSDPKVVCCETCIHFFNRENGKSYKFLTKNPVVEGWSLEDQCPYHIDPHPRFVLNDTLISFTTIICGRVDVAFVSTEQLMEATK